MLTAKEIVRCLLRDLGDVDACIRYAERVAGMRGEDAHAYAQAAQILKEEFPSVRLTGRELATVLAALRYWQRDLANNGAAPIPDHFDAEVTPLTVAEIDDLCERLNGGTPAT